MILPSHTRMLALVATIVDKTVEKISLSSAFSSKQTNDHISPSLPGPRLNVNCFVGHKQFLGNQHFPNQHCIGGGWGGAVTVVEFRKKK